MMAENTSPQQDELRTIEKINILLKEYDTLRTEAIARINSRFAFLGLLIAVVAFAGSKNSTSTWVAAVVISIPLLGIWLYLGHLLCRISDGVVRIEREVNKLAGAHLLDWEARGSGRLLQRAHDRFVAPAAKLLATRSAE